MAIEKNKVVSIDYTLTDPQGQVMDTSQGREPLVYLHGVGTMLPGLEEALEGKNTGDEFKVVVNPDKAYGMKNPDLVRPVPRSAFQGVDEVKAGMQFQAQTPQGPRLVTVTAVSGEEVTVDANHPLAGMTLHFDVNVRDIREATAEELEHGHVHGAGGHHH